MWKRVMLIDDDVDEHLFFQWSVESIDRSLKLLHAHSLDEAEELLQASLPDIIFLDMHMPVADGFQCIERLRGRSDLQDTPIYMYSTAVDENSVHRAVQLGASGGIKKSRNNGDLRENLSAILASERLITDGSQA